MTTVSAWLMLVALLVGLGGIVLSARLRTSRTRLFGLITTFAATVVTGWIAWYAGIQV